MKQCLILLLLCLFVFNTQAQDSTTYYPKREFRAVWIATVDNIDWPSTSALGNVARQKQEFIRILNQHQRNGLNAIVMQVRPAADAFYPSRLEPWSEWLTGQQGKPPSPYYDPLLFMIEEAHKRNMEIHAWINPYRAVFNTNKTKLAPTHISKIHPEWFLTYGDKRYFDPGNPEGQQHVLRVVKDLAERYSELDAIHMDDYFYPYKIPGKEFPDAASFAKYGRNLNKDDWRRSNCDSIVKHIAEVIKSVNPQMRFGISPFGVWRNNDKDPEGSNSRAGATNYDDLYANILLWLQKGWIDYVVPQLYWEMEHPKVAFEVLIDWWASHAYGRHLYIGQGVYKVNEKTAKGWKEKDQLPRQIRLLREYETVQGSVIFSSKSIERNPFNWCDSLQENYYRYPALLPALPWIDSVPPPKPSVNYSYGGKAQMVLLKKAENSETIKSFVIYAFDKTKPMDAENPANIYKIIPAMSKETKVDLSALAEKRATHQFAVTAVDWVNNESELLPLKL